MSSLEIKKCRKKNDRNRHEDCLSSLVQNNHKTIKHVLSSSSIYDDALSVSPSFAILAQNTLPYAKEISTIQQKTIFGGFNDSLKNFVTKNIEKPPEEDGVEVKKIASQVFFMEEEIVQLLGKKEPDQEKQDEEKIYFKMEEDDDDMDAYTTDEEDMDYGFFIDFPEEMEETEGSQPILIPNAGHKER